MCSINERDDAIQGEFITDFIIHEKCLGNRPWIGKPGGFNQHVIEFVASFHQVPKNPDQISTNSATNTAVGHFKNFFISIDDKPLINTNFSILILNDSNTFAMFFT